jgi:hypothetical protein
LFVVVLRGEKLANSLDEDAGVLVVLRRKVHEPLGSAERVKGFPEYAPQLLNRTYRADLFLEAAGGSDKTWRARWNKAWEFVHVT